LSRFKSKIKSFLQKLIEIGIQKDDSDLLKFQKRFNNTMGLLMGVGGVVFGGVCLLFKLYLASYIPLTYAVLLTINFLYYLYSKNYKFLTALQIMLTIFVPLTFYLVFGHNIPIGMIALWVLFPLVYSIVVSGLRSTIYWFLFVACFYIFSVFYGKDLISFSIDVDNHIIELFFEINAIIISGVLIGIMIFFVKNKEHEYDKLHLLANSLDKTVKKRTIELKENVEELQATKEELIQQNKQLHTLYENIEDQKKHIEKIHGDLNQSIQVTKTIQESLLNKNNIIESCVDEYFVFYRPKDMVSGDFYYMNKINNNLIFTVADCTGHGVSGGFLMALSISYLHEIVKIKHVDNTTKAVEMLRNRFNDLGLGIHFGCDIALCVIDIEKNIIQYAGAFIPLIIIRDKKILEFKANRFPASTYVTEDDFKNHEIVLEDNDIIYLFTDGFADQFGGENDRKFTGKRFKDLLIEIHSKPMQEQKEILTKTFDNWKKYGEQVDDVTILSLKWKKSYKDKKEEKLSQIVYNN